VRRRFSQGFPPQGQPPGSPASGQRSHTEPRLAGRVTDGFFQRQTIRQRNRMGYRRGQSPRESKCCRSRLRLLSLFSFCFRPDRALINWGRNTAKYLTCLNLTLPIISCLAGARNWDQIAASENL
jgi:hypothetical protein